ncbi:TPA: hypothetical protein N0F65_000425 [Lagenidium giganteum]|uniref:Uncharacterized protein n=1 Tax=Lagenidium giganteum TaxID=4803 RepID=A0AAV2YLN9_9STRA|nr:TPA: hypothetical protein N0F65_000425 [Lagenidium giganteum]
MSITTDASITTFVRALCRGVGRHNRNTHLLHRWRRAGWRGHVLEAAIHAFLSAMPPPPPPPKRVAFNVNLHDDMSARRATAFPRLRLKHW